MPACACSSASKKARRSVNGGSDSIAYTDWKLGVTKDISGWLIGLAYVDTNAKGNCGNTEFYCFANSWNSNGLGGKTRDAGGAVAVLSVTKTF